MLKHFIIKLKKISKELPNSKDKNTFKASIWLKEPATSKSDNRNC